MKGRLAHGTSQLEAAKSHNDTMSVQNRPRHKHILLFFLKKIFRFLMMWLWCGDGIEGRSEVVGEANTTIRQSKKCIKTDTKKPPGHLKILSGSSQRNGVGRKL